MWNLNKTEGGKGRGRGEGKEGKKMKFLQKSKNNILIKNY